MKRKISKIISAAFIALAFVATSCRNNDEPVLANPEIIGLEVGIGNTHTSYIGTDIHIEAEIEAQGKINTVEVEVFKENGSGWKKKEVFTEFSGLLNTNFHKHIDIPSDAEPGVYVFRMKVTDMRGNSTVANEPLELIVLVDDVPPVVNITSAPESGKTFLNGETISITGTVSDNLVLSNVLVALVREEDNIADSSISAANPKIIVMGEIRDFDSPEFHDFISSIKVGAAKDNAWNPKEIQGENAWKTGNYYIVVKVRDASQNISYSQHYPIKISL